MIPHCLNNIKFLFLVIQFWRPWYIHTYYISFLACLDFLIPNIAGQKNAGMYDWEIKIHIRMRETNRPWLSDICTFLSTSTDVLRNILERRGGISRCEMSRDIQRPTIPPLSNRILVRFPFRLVFIRTQCFTTVFYELECLKGDKLGYSKQVQ